MERKFKVPLVAVIAGVVLLFVIVIVVALVAGKKKPQVVQAEPSAPQNSIAPSENTNANVTNNVTNIVAYDEESVTKDMEDIIEQIKQDYADGKFDSDNLEDIITPENLVGYNSNYEYEVTFDEDSVQIVVITALDHFTFEIDGDLNVTLVGSSVAGNNTREEDDDDNEDDEDNNNDSSDGSKDAEEALNKALKALKNDFDNGKLGDEVTYALTSENLKKMAKDYEFEVSWNSGGSKAFITMTKDDEKYDVEVDNNFELKSFEY